MEIHNLNNIENLNHILQNYKKGEWLINQFIKGNTNTTAMLIYKESQVYSTNFVKNNISEMYEEITGKNQNTDVNRSNLHTTNISERHNDESVKYCTKDNKKIEIYVLRIYGCEGLIDRKKEMKNCCLLAKHNLAPKIRLQFNFGIIQDYLDGVDLDPKNLESEMKHIAMKMKEWHSIKINETEPILFKFIDKWYGMAQKKHADLLQKLKIKERICKYKQMIDEKYRIELFQNTTNKQASINQNDKDNITDFCVNEQNYAQSNATKKESYKIEMADTKIYKKKYIAFCHNDLLASNILKLRNGLVYFIDYEYSGCNFIAFDIANHFAEYAGYEFEVSKIPEREQIIEFLRYYGNTDIIDDVLFFMPLSHLLWGLWALLRDGDFDYYKYAIQRLDEFVKAA